MEKEITTNFSEGFQQGRSCNSQSLKLMKGISPANAATRPRTMAVSQI